MFPDGFLNFLSFDVGTMVIDAPWEVSCFPYVLFLTKFIIYEVYTVISTTRSICKSFVNPASTGAGRVFCIRAAFVQQTSCGRTSLKAWKSSMLSTWIWLKKDKINSKNSLYRKKTQISSCLVQIRDMRVGRPKYLPLHFRLRQQPWTI